MGTSPENKIDNKPLPSVPNDLFALDARIAIPTPEIKKLTGYDFEGFKARYLDGAIEKMESSGNISFSEKEREWLATFAEASYNIDTFISEGEDAYTLARVSLAYALAECYFYHNAEIDIITPPETDTLHLLDKDFSEGLPESLDFVARVLELIPESSETNGYYSDLIKDLHFARKLIIEGKDFSDVTAKDPYFPIAIPLYIIAKNMAYRKHNGFVRGGGISGIARDELKNTAMATIIAEQPSEFHNPNFLRFRKNWSRMAVITQEYWLRETAFPAYAFGNWALNEVTMSENSSERWEKALSLNITDFCPETDFGDIIFTADSSPKGVFGALQKVLKNEEIFQLMNDILGSTETDPRKRIEMFALIVDQYLPEEKYKENESVQALFNKVIGKFMGIKDALRLRVIVDDGKLDGIAQQISETNPDSYILFERGLADNSEIKTHQVATEIIKGTSIETSIAQWHSDSEGQNSMSSFGALFVEKQIGGIPYEMQVMTVSDSYHNWDSRRRYKSLPRTH